MATERKRKLRHGVIAWGILFAVVLVTSLCVMSYVLLTSAMHVQYERHLRGVINYIDDEIDADDMRECIETGKTTKKWDAVQQLLNDMVDDNNLTFIYVTIPVMRKGNIPSHMFNIVSSTTEEEVANGEEDTPFGDTTYVYPDKEMQKFVDAMGRTGFSFFEESSEWGSFYTGCKPLVTSDGETIALISADISLNELHHQTKTFLGWYAVLTVIVCAVNGTVVVMMLQRRVVLPILVLDQAMQRFTETGIKSVDEDNPLMSLPDIPDIPDIGADNEIGDLAESFEQMTQAIREYMRELATSRFETVKAERTAIAMAGLAHKDVMTGVKNKTAYVEYIEQLDEELESPTSDIEFAVVVIDLNDLKGVNDTYGHQSGDEYIVGTCQTMSQVFKHSPVFRIGGDEFVAILRNHDYRHREELLGNLIDQLRESERDETVSPWLRYSASVGMARYHRDEDEKYADVFSKADNRMYGRKKLRKFQADGRTEAVTDMGEVTENPPVSDDDSTGQSEQVTESNVSHH